ncbi:zinc-binding domain protein [gamma proteobacterium HTCC5015]|nr:zinc-binding domain protein [gamma proteobacterium HTCC5015]
MSDELRLRDECYMQLALEQAELAAQVGEVPVGAVLVQGDEVIASAFNRPIAEHDPTAHAEIQVLRQAGQSQQNYRLCDTTLYVTLEPCVMCVGAILHARIGRLVYAAAEPKMGAVDSAFSLLRDERHFHRMQVASGVLEAPSRELIQSFFRQRRDAKKAEKSS